MELTTEEKITIISALGSDKKRMVEYMFEQKENQAAVDKCINYINKINAIMEKLK